MKYTTILLLALAVHAKAQLRTILKEDFSDNDHGWFEGTTGINKLQVKNGSYLLQADTSGWMTYFNFFLDERKDFVIEASFTQTSGVEEYGIGLIWGFGKGKSGDKMNSFLFTTNGYYKVTNTENLVDQSWKSTTAVKAKGQPNRLRIEQKSGKLSLVLNNKEQIKLNPLPWYGRNLGFVAHAKMSVLIDDFVVMNDTKLNLVKNLEPVGPMENLGNQINTIYDEVGPKISADGKTLYFGRKKSPDNIGGVEDKEDIWFATRTASGSWARAQNMGAPVNNASVNNLLSVSTDNNTLLFHTSNGFAVIHRTATGWTAEEDLGIFFENESSFLEGCLSPDGKAILFTAKLKENVYYKTDDPERDIYVCTKLPNGSWSKPVNTGKSLNSPGDEYSPFMAADGKTLYFATDGRPGYGDVDIFMSKRIGDSWTNWTEPANLGSGVNTNDFEAYYTLPASGDFGYLVSNNKSIGLADIIRFKLPQSLRPDPVTLVSGFVLDSKTKKPVPASVHFDDLATGKEIGEARSDPKTGRYSIVLPAGKHYGYRASAQGFLSVNENLELETLANYDEFKKDLFLVPIELGESIQLKNVFFELGKSDLRSESYPELDRLAKILVDNPKMEIELSGHTDYKGSVSDNLALSQKRVESVKAYLVSKGVAAVRISGKGYGGTKPISTSAVDKEREVNRRVEFKIVRK